MKLVSVKCPQCGGDVEVDGDFKSAFCPYCKSAFVIEHNDFNKEKPVYETIIVDADPNEVKNEVDMYALFGWDLKHRKTYKAYDGKRYFKNGNSRDKYKDVVQLTFQRDLKADWCTDELKTKCDRFFQIREEYNKANAKFASKEASKSIDSLSKKNKANSRYNAFLALSITLGVFIFFVLLLSGISAESQIATLILLTLSFASLIFGIVLAIHFFKKGKRKENEISQKTKDDYEKAKAILFESQKVKLNEMQEIANWAGKHMALKFGFETKVEIDGWINR